MPATAKSSEDEFAVIKDTNQFNLNTENGVFNHYIPLNMPSKHSSY